MLFADVKNDIAFRKIFGNSKKTNILISFLNAVLQLEGESKIASIRIENPYQFPRIAGEKASILDVKATEVSGRQFIVEMQVAEADGFDKRVQYYASRDYTMQLGKGDKYTKLNPTVFIGILNFSYFKGRDYLSYHSLLDEKTLEHRLKDLRFAFIELPKFNKKSHELVDAIDKWTYFIKNAETLTIMPDNIEDEGLLDAYDEATTHKWSKRDLRAYDNAFIAEQDVIGITTLAVRRAVEQNTQEVTKEVQQEVAKKMKAKGFELQEIADMTGLSIAEIEVI